MTYVTVRRDAMVQTTMSASESSQSPQEHRECVHRQVTCMGGGLWQTTNFANQLFPAYLPCFFYRLVPGQLRDGRCARHRWHTSFSAEGNVGNASPIQFQRKFQDVSANGILQARARIGSFNLARVSRILKMIQKFSGIHRAIVMRQACALLEIPPLE